MMTTHRCKSWRRTLPLVAGRRRTQFVMSRTWTAVGIMVALLPSIKSTIQWSRLVMINSESMGIEEASRSDVRVSKHPDLEVNERCEVGDLLVVSAGTDASTCGGSDGGFSDLSLRLNEKLG